MLGLLLAQLEQARELARVIGAEDEFIDEVSGGRASLGELETCHRGDSSAGVLLDMLVQAVAYLAKRPGGLGEAEVRSWLDSSDTIARRLGLYALRESTDLNCATKEAWTRECVARYPAESSEWLVATELLAQWNAPAPGGTASAEPVSPPPPPTALPPLNELLAMGSRPLVSAVCSSRPTTTAVLEVLLQLGVAAHGATELADHELWDLLLGHLRWRQLAADERDTLMEILQQPFSVTTHARAVLGCLFEQDLFAADAHQTQPAATQAQAQALLTMSRLLWTILRDHAGPEPEDYSKAVLATPSRSRSSSYTVRHSPGC